MTGGKSSSRPPSSPFLRIEVGPRLFLGPPGAGMYRGGLRARSGSGNGVGAGCSVVGVGWEVGGLSCLNCSVEDLRTLADAMEDQT